MTNLETNHYEKLIEDYKSKFLPEAESDVVEEETDVRSSSVLTDSLSDTISKDDKDHLLENLIKELNKLAEEDVDEEELTDTLQLAKRPRKLKKGKEKVQTAEHREKKEEENKKLSDQVIKDDSEILEFPEEEEGEEELLGEDYMEDSSQVDHEEENINREVLMKRAYIYQVLDSLIPEYEEELKFYLREGESELFAEDLPVVLQCFGVNPSKQECAKIVQRVKDAGGKMSFLDFLVMLARLTKDAFTTDDVLEAFRLLDLNDNGEIPVPLLREVLMTVGERLSEEEMSLMINEGDPLGEGVIKYEELVRRMERNLYVATPSKRKALIKILRKEDRRKRIKGDQDEESTLMEEVMAEEEEEVDPIFGTPISK